MSAPAQIDPAAVAGFLLRNRTSVIAVGIAAGVLSAAISLILPPRFTARTSFVADQGSGMNLSSNLLGLAGAFGASLPGASSSPAFYAAVAGSERIFEAIASHPGYPQPVGGSGSLAEALRTTHADPARQRYRTIRRLRRSVAISAEPRTGIVQISVDARTPELAAAIADQFLTAIDSFNVHVRQSRGGEEESFVARRLDSAAADLRAAELNLLAFQRQNRTVQSPELQLQQGRLQRAVELRQSLFLMLNQQYEQARIAARRDVPAVTVIERPEPPVQRSFPRRTLLVAGATIVTTGFWALVLVALAVWRERWPPDRWPATLRRAVRP